MCKFQVINNNSFGCIVKCTSCKHLHLGFGNVLAAFEPDELNRFISHIENIHREIYADLLLSGERIYVNTDSEKFAIALTPAELNELNTLLSETRIMLEAHAILNNEKN